MGNAFRCDRCGKLVEGTAAYDHKKGFWPKSVNPSGSKHLAEFCAGCRKDYHQWWEVKPAKENPLREVLSDLRMIPLL